MSNITNVILGETDIWRVIVLGAGLFILVILLAFVLLLLMIRISL